MLVQLVFLAICSAILADPLPKPSYNVDDYEVVGGHFEKFIETHNKHYDADEKAKRFAIFIENLKDINRLNKEHKLTTYDINKFADLTEAEHRSWFGIAATIEGDDYLGDCKELKDPTSKDAPAAWDWRDQKAVSPAKSQQACGSCWAFSATALVESKYLQKSKQVTLSEQQLVDCVKLSYGCEGGLMSWALTDIMARGGQESEANYPYAAKQGTCQFDSTKIAAKVSNCTGYSLSGEGALKELLYKEGPLSMALNAVPWKRYVNGIFEDCVPDVILNHAVLLVGYGTEGGVDYWVIKNSWGPDWGENGFIRLKRGINCSGIGNDISWATISANVE